MLITRVDNSPWTTRIPWRVPISLLTHKTEMLQVQSSLWKIEELTAMDSVPAGRTWKQLWFCHSFLSELGAIKSNEEIPRNIVLVVREAYLSHTCLLVGSDGSFTTQTLSYGEASSWHRSTCMGREKKVSPSHMLHQCYQQRPGELCWAFFTRKLPCRLVWGAWDPLQGQRYKRTFLQKGFCEVYFSSILFFWSSFKRRVHKRASGAPGGAKAGWEYSSKWYHQQGLNPEPSAPPLLPELREQHLSW